MRVYVLTDEEAISKALADEIVAVFKAKPNGIFGTATGSSPLSTYRELGRRVKAGEVSFAKVTSFQLDEYVGLPVGHPQTYQQVILRDFASQIDIDPTNVHAPNGMATDLVAAGKDYEAQLRAVGGVDYQILGIGSDGHIAFNEPGGSLDSLTHQEELAEQTRLDNARFFDGDVSKVPTSCLTQGIGTILRARQIGLVALGTGKANAVAAMLTGPVSSQCPASALQNHPSVSVFLDTAAASKLPKDFQFTPVKTSAR